MQHGVNPFSSMFPLLLCPLVPLSFSSSNLESKIKKRLLLRKFFSPAPEAHRGCRSNAVQIFVLDLP